MPGPVDWLVAIPWLARIMAIRITTLEFIGKASRFAI
jgi:hypothetical protein